MATQQTSPRRSKKQSPSKITVARWPFPLRQVAVFLIIFSVLGGGYAVFRAQAATSNWTVVQSTRFIVFSACKSYPIGSDGQKIKWKVQNVSGVVVNGVIWRSTAVTIQLPTLRPPANIVELGGSYDAYPANWNYHTNAKYSTGTYYGDGAFYMNPNNLIKCAGGGK
jgi:hypothetical protein